eukprot:TRINITY_DN5310_c0_g1_i1.p1 TRINITY_DN5310_c0_g1~~TRINITY_DN5310_c0_g1_i1.p1  ORF type:complete len:332 (+),score=57.01 TRINITY_DN5310_c0_g1_i1:79-1074(+)
MAVGPPAALLVAHGALKLNASSSDLQPQVDGKLSDEPPVPPPPEPHPAQAGIRRSRLRLGKSEDVSEIQRRPYLCSGYRLERPALRHFWSSHNELVNMWTHLLGGFVAIKMTADWIWNHDSMLTQESWYSARFAYFCAITMWNLTAVCAMFVSAIFHWKSCDCDERVLHWTNLDQNVCGLVALLGFFAGIPMGFHCYPMLQLAYMAQTVVVGITMAVLLIWVIPKENWMMISTVITLGALSSTVPAVHWLAISSMGRQVAGLRLVGCISLGIAACSVYFSYFPERWSRPGRFDLLGNSHQIWHVLIYGTIWSYGQVLSDVFDLSATDAYCQ